MGKSYKKEGKTEVYPFWNMEDIKNMIDYFKKKEMWHWYLVFNLGLLLGRRVGDTLSFKWSDFFYKNGRMKDEMDIKEQKTGKGTRPYISGACKDAIQYYIDKTGVDPVSAKNYNDFIITNPEKSQLLQHKDEYAEEYYNDLMGDILRSQAAAYRKQFKLGELVALKHDVFDGNTFKIRRTETRYKVSEGKYAYDIKEYPKSEAGVRTVVIPEDYVWLCSKIRNLNPFGDYVFVDEKGKRMTTNCIRRRQERNCKALGIYRKSPHKIRKTYGTILLDNNIDNRLIMGQMGHTDIMCTENHYHRNRRSIDRKSQVLSSIKEFQQISQ